MFDFDGSAGDALNGALSDGYFPMSGLIGGSNPNPNPNPNPSPSPAPSPNPNRNPNPTLRLHRRLGPRLHYRGLHVDRRR